jgi:hypothetical protein
MAGPACSSPLQGEACVIGGHRRNRFVGTALLVLSVLALDSKFSGLQAKDALKSFSP